MLHCTFSVEWVHSDDVFFKLERLSCIPNIQHSLLVWPNHSIQFTCYWITLFFKHWVSNTIPTPTSSFYFDTIQTFYLVKYFFVNLKYIGLYIEHSRIYLKLFTLCYAIVFLMRLSLVHLRITYLLMPFSIKHKNKWNILLMGSSQ